MVKGRQFKDFRDTGEANTAIRIYSAQDADELVFLDIQASRQSHSALLEVVRAAARECFMPLSAGGGVSSLADVRELLLAGADKVVINSAAIAQPDLVVQAAERFGNQCIIGGIDYRGAGRDARVWVRCGSEATALDPVEYAQRLVGAGVGEIFLQSIDRDGMMQGYDLKTSAAVAAAVSVPVIVCGGAGHFKHLADAFTQTDVAAAACASLFHFGDNNPIRARSYLRNQQVLMRVLR